MAKHNIQYTGEQFDKLLNQIPTAVQIGEKIDSLKGSGDISAATVAEVAVQGEKLSELDGKIEEITAKMESSYIDITDNYEFSNGKISSLRNKGAGATFNGDYSASDNNYRHLILDTQEGEEFYIIGESYDYYNIATFIDTTTNTIIGSRLRSMGSSHIQKIITPEGANQVVFIFYIKNGNPFGFYRKAGNIEIEGGILHNIKYDDTLKRGYFTLTLKGSTTNLTYLSNQQVDFKQNAHSNYNQLDLSVKEGEIYYFYYKDGLSLIPNNAPFYVILDESDSIVDIHLGNTVFPNGFIKIPARGVRLVANLTAWTFTQQNGWNRDSYIQKYEKTGDAKTGREISRKLAKGGIEYIRNGKVGDVIPSLTYSAYSFEVSILTECEEGDYVYSNINNQSSNNYLIAFISSTNEILYRYGDNTTTVLQATAPRGTKYVYISFFCKNWIDPTEDISVYINNTHKHLEYIDETIKENDFIVPSTFRCLIGQQKVIYYDNLLKGQDCGLNSPASLACTINVAFNELDMNYDRCWSIAANKLQPSKVGSYKLVLDSYDHRLKLTSRSTKTMKVIPKTGLASNHNIVIIGDSNIDGSYILKTIYDRFVWLGGVQPTFVGSKTSTIDGVTINHEGKSGTTVGQWTNSSSSFWNSGASKLDVANYRSKNNISGYIDVAVIALGINDCILTGGPGASSIKPLVDAFLEDNPNCKVILELPHLGANTMGGGWMAYPYANKKISYYNNVLAQRKSYIDYYENTPEYIGKVVIGEGCYCIDRYYGFPNSTLKMSNIIDVQEFVHTNCVHPNRMGYEQEGQEYFVTILDMLQTIEAEN